MKCWNPKLLRLHALIYSHRQIHSGINRWAPRLGHTVSYYVSIICRLSPLVENLNGDVSSWATTVKTQTVVVIYNHTVLSRCITNSWDAGLMGGNPLQETHSDWICQRWLSVHKSEYLNTVIASVTLIILAECSVHGVLVTSPWDAAIFAPLANERVLMILLQYAND